MYRQRVYLAPTSKIADAACIVAFGVCKRGIDIQSCKLSEWHAGHSLQIAVCNVNTAWFKLQCKYSMVFASGHELMLVLCKVMTLSVIGVDEDEDAMSDKEVEAAAAEEDDAAGEVEDTGQLQSHCKCLIQVAQMQTQSAELPCSRCMQCAA